MLQLKVQLFFAKIRVYLNMARHTKNISFLYIMFVSTQDHNSDQYELKVEMVKN